MLRDKGSTSLGFIVLLVILAGIAIYAYSFAGWPGVVGGLVLGHIALIWLTFIAFGPFFISAAAAIGAYIHLCIVMLVVYFVFGESFGDKTAMAIGDWFKSFPELVHFECLEPYLAEYDLYGDKGTVEMGGWNGPVNFAIYFLGLAVILKGLVFLGQKGNAA